MHPAAKARAHGIIPWICIAKKRPIIAAIGSTIPDRIPLDDLSYDEDALRILDNQIAESKRFIENNLLLAYTEKGRGTSK